MHFVRFLLVLVLAAIPAAAFSAVRIAGLDDQLETNARALMSIASVACDTPDWRVERLFRDADQQLQHSLEALGYYRFVFDKKLSFEDPNCWRATFDITLGEPVRIRDVTVTIDGEVRYDADYFATEGAKQPEPDSILNHGVYERYKRSILSRLTTRGYFNAEFIDSSVIVDESLSYADINIHIETGARHQFGDVTFTGGILTQKLLKGYLKFRKGDDYDAEKISKLYDSLTGSGYFGSVSIAALPVEGGGSEVPVIVSLTPAKRRVYTVGAGYATDTGVQGRLGYTNRRRNERGHQFDARLFLSSVESELTGIYRLPRGRPDKEWASLYGGFLRKRTDTSASDKTTIGIRISRNRTEGWLETPYIDFSNERFLVAEQDDIARLLTPGIIWEKVVGRELGRVQGGHRISFDVRGSHDNLFSDTTFFQATASSKWITPLGESTRFLARVDLGTTLARELEELPATVRFFAGGDTSVRGYGFEAIGPVNDDGNVTGGENLVVMSIEADWQVTTNWAIALFADSGSAFNGSDADFSSGIGIGLRWYSPLGPIRVNVAHPLDDPDSDYRLHITFGPDL